MLIDGQENETIDQAVPSHSNCEGRKIADSVKHNRLPCPKIEANKARGKAVQRWQSSTGIGGAECKNSKDRHGWNITTYHRPLHCLRARTLSASWVSRSALGNPGRRTYHPVQGCACCLESSVSDCRLHKCNLGSRHHGRSALSRSLVVHSAARHAEFAASSMSVST
jgi:hypothetical protein